MNKYITEKNLYIKCILKFVTRVYFVIDTKFKKFFPNRN